MQMLTRRAVEVVGHGHAHGGARTGPRRIPGAHEGLRAAEQLRTGLTGSGPVRRRRRPQRRVGEEAGGHAAAAAHARVVGLRGAGRVTDAVDAIAGVDEAVVVEGLGLGGVLARVPPLGRRAVQVPEHAPPRVQEAGGLAPA